MIDGFLTPTLRDIDYLSPTAPYPVIPSGITVHQNTIYRYSIPTEEQPTLTILNYIPDYNGNFIKPGHYELALSNDKEFLYIIESKNLIAIIPVFKLEENQRELKKYYIKHSKLNKEEKKELKINKKNKQIKDIINKRYAITGATPPKEPEYMEASIEYNAKGHFYLIKYEKGIIRAWGAIKIKIN